jgi:Tfp pilus assembly protein PilF
MRRFTIAILFVAALAGSSGVSAQTANDCYQATLRQNDHEIIRICSAALEKGGMNDENRSVVTSNRGLGYLRDKQYDRAIVDFSDALVINPRNPYSFNFRGEAWREKGNLDRAFADFGEALRIDPAFTGAMYNRGVTFERQGDLSSARAEYRKAVATRGDSALDQWARDRSRERLAALGESQPQQQPRSNDGGRGTGGRER